MKLIYFLIIILMTSIVLSCSKTNNSSEFIEQATGRYLYNSDEIIEVYFNNSDLFMKWRGANSIKPMTFKDNTFFVKEMNKKVQFLTNPSDKKYYISLVPKEKNKPITYNFRKLNENEKVPSEYLKNNEFDKALEGYLAIQKKDSLNINIKEYNFNKLGYRSLEAKRFKNAINIFKINVALHPNSSNVYDSLADAFMQNGDTIQAINNYKKSLKLDSGNSNAKRKLERLEKK